MLKTKAEHIHLARVKFKKKKTHRKKVNKHTLHSHTFIHMNAKKGASKFQKRFKCNAEGESGGTI